MIKFLLRRTGEAVTPMNAISNDVWTEDVGDETWGKKRRTTRGEVKSYIDWLFLLLSVPCYKHLNPSCSLGRSLPQATLGGCIGLATLAMFTSCRSHGLDACGASANDAMASDD